MGDLILLPARQQEVLELLNQGLVERTIAAKLWVSYNTVRTHTRKIRDYFDAHSNRSRYFGRVRGGLSALRTGRSVRVLFWRC